MSEVATRKDIEEVIDIMKDFMAEVSLQFTEVHKRLETQDKKYDRLILPLMIS